jgi:hypothetical protein
MMMSSNSICPLVESAGSSDAKADGILFSGKIRFPGLKNKFSEVNSKLFSPNKLKIYIIYYLQTLFLSTYM